MSLIGETGDDKFDGVYTLGSVIRGQKVQIAPELDFVLESEDTGGQQGVISVAFLVPGRKFSITLTDYDYFPTEESHGDGVSGPQWYTFSSDKYTYRIIGTGSERPYGSKPWLFYRVTRERRQA